jgi:hypothetical protein
MTDAPAPQGLRIYDVYFAVPGRWRFYVRNPNHGITVADVGISWTLDGTPAAAAYADIAAIHLQKSALGNAVNTINECKIAFTNGAALVVNNASATGLPSDGQTPTYRAFVHDLHRRLAAGGGGPTRFTAGVSAARYRALLITLIVAGLILIVTPLGLTAMTGDWHMLIATIVGAALLWPVFLLMSKNKPRQYTADRLPEELLS